MRRYAGDQASHVVVLAEPSPAAGRTPEPRRWLGRERAPAPAGHAGGTRATVIDAVAVPQHEARAWLESAVAAGGDARLDAALGVVNRLLHGHAIAAGDPYVHEVAPHHAVATRLGFGPGEDVAEGHWTRAMELAAVSPARGSQPALRATERLGALLGARDVALAAELLVLRARLDLDHDRAREAALQLHTALSAALAELESWRDVGDLAVRLEELRRLEPGVAAAAGAALEGGLQEAELDTVRAGIARLEAALRARAAQARG